MNIVNVGWFDGYYESFDKVKEVRFGGKLLWIEFTSGQNRHIPLDQVRWYSIYPASHELFIP